VLKSQPKPKRIEDPDYLEWIESLSCMLCGRAGAGFKEGKSDAHHIPPKGHGTMAGKCDDKRAVPLCNDQHREYHQIGRDTFADKYGLAYEAIIEGLNALYEEQGGILNGG